MSNSNKHTPGHVPLEKRYDLIHTRVWLDGQPAIIMGAQTEFAWVCAQAFPFNKVEFAWETVQRIVETKAGRFSTGGAE